MMQIMKGKNWIGKLQKWKERREKLYKLHEEGQSISDLAQREGITERSMNLLLQKVKRANEKTRLP